MATKRTLGPETPPEMVESYLALPYRLDVIDDGDGSYVVCYPELPGCFTQVDDLTDAD